MINDYYIEKKNADNYSVENTQCWDVFQNYANYTKEQKSILTEIKLYFNIKGKINISDSGKIKL
jgi:hypothetical protein